MSEKSFSAFSRSALASGVLKVEVGKHIIIKHAHIPTYSQLLVSARALSKRIQAVGDRAFQVEAHSDKEWQRA